MGRRTCKPSQRTQKREKIEKPPMLQTEHGGFALLKNFCNAFQPIAYCRPAVMRLCCNVRQRKPLNVPQKSYLSVYPPKRCVFDGGFHLLSVKSLQRRGQHYASRRHRQYRARKVAAAVQRCAPYCQAWQTGDILSPFCWHFRDGMFS